MPDDPLTVIVIGAHPDDPDVNAGGVAVKYADAGHDVRFLSLTSGDAGHHEIGGPDLARRRRAEVEAVADLADIAYDVFEIHDGELRPSLENRERVIRYIRRHEPDLVLTHRPNDYHPDHRYTARLVQDAAYMVTVPNICPDVGALAEDPVIAYLQDDFEKPYPFDPDVVVDIDDVVDHKLDLLDCHKSQMYEWLPYEAGLADEVPDGEAARREWLAEWRRPDFEATADRFRGALVDRYGDRGETVQCAEAFEACEYGAPLEDADELFPF